MKNQILIFSLAFLMLGCKKDDDQVKDIVKSDEVELRTIKSIEIEDIAIDSSLNIRALEILKDKSGCIFLNANGTGGLVSDYNKNGKDTTEVFHVFERRQDKLNINYRALALTETASFGLSIGSPAYLLTDGHDGAYVVYSEEHEDAFYDSMDFWNDIEGIAIGDPTDNCMSIIITRDGGDNWTKINCIDLPKVLEGEAAFAASDTNIAIVGDHTWVATGGMASRVLYSPDKGKSWEVFETPIIQGKETTGIYSIDFYDALNGFAIGGDYTDPEVNRANKIRTKDGGRTWELVADGMEPGYRSCVQYVPESEAKELIAIGFNGIDYSADAGENWTQLSDEGFYTIRFLTDSTAYAAGKGRISKLILKR